MSISLWKIFKIFLISGPLVFALGCARIITPDLRHGTQLSGVVQLARVSGAMIRVYALLEDGSKGSLLAEATTNAEGEYTVSVGSFSGHVLIESNGGTYLDEATGDTKAASALSAIVHSSAASDAAISPMSTLVKERIVALASGASIEAAKTVATNEVARLFGVLPEDLAVLPTSATALVGTDAKATRAAMGIAAFSYFLNDFRMNGSAVSVSDALDALSDDLKDDGKLNGSTSSTLAKSIAIQWTTAMTAARGLAAANSSLVFSRVSSQISDALASTAIDTGSNLDGLHDGSFYINGVNTELLNGTGSFLGTYYYFGNLAQVTDGLMDDGFYYQDGILAQGYNTTDSIYYLAGQATTLDGNGNGYNTNDSIYYIAGQPTSLDENGNGLYNNTYYIAGQPTSLDSSGSGFYNDQFYVNGNVQTLDQIDGLPAIYVSSNGNDISGVGTQSSPLLTSQKAFERAYVLSGEIIIKLGTGNFGGVNLSDANATQWPIRIKLYGEGATQSFLGGINGDALTGEGADGRNISIISNKTVDLGDISSNGGFSANGGSIVLTSIGASGSITANGGPGSAFYGTDGGTIILTDSVSGPLTANGGSGHWGGGGGGTITLTDSVSGPISANGVDALNWDVGGGAGGGGGTITLTKSTSGGAIRADGGSSFHYGGPGGSITLTDSTSNEVISANGGDGKDNNFPGHGGSISLMNSGAGAINANGGTEGVCWVPYSGGGNISLTNSTWSSLSVLGGSCSTDGNGTITIDGSLLSGLDGYGSGFVNGQCYASAKVLNFSGTGLCGPIYYIAGQPTSLDSNGNGTYSDVLYLSASPFTGISDGTVGESGKYYSQGRLLESVTAGGVVYYWGIPWTGTGDGIVGDFGRLYQNGVPFNGLGTGNFGEWNKYYFNGVIANGEVNGELYVDGVLIPACNGDCYLEGSAPDYARGLMNGTIRRGPNNTVIVLQQNGMSGFKVWVEQNGSRILNATGFIANGWQKALNRAGTEPIGDLTSSTVIAQIEGRVCPGKTLGSGVFVNFDNMVDSTRCLYYDSGNVAQSLDAAHPDNGGAAENREGEDWLRRWLTTSNEINPNPSQRSLASYYEGNIKTCADKGMRLPTFYETSVTSNDYGGTNDQPEGDFTINGGSLSSHPTFAGANGVPSFGWSWTASANTNSTFRNWKWSNTRQFVGSYLVSSEYYWAFYTVRCVLP